MQHQVNPTNQTQDNGQKPHFGTLDHSKMLFCDFRMILHDLIVGKHLVLSEYAISSGSDRPKSRKRPKTYFSALWIIHIRILQVFE